MEKLGNSHKISGWIIFQYEAYELSIVTVSSEFHLSSFVIFNFIASFIVEIGMNINIQDNFLKENM